MVSINYATREVTCKIVYYGPGLSGKTTNLQYVHQKVPGETKGKLISLATDADRTLYFDFLPINIGTINGFAAKFQLYTVPGQVYYNATRKLVLRGVDGIVFVADSQPDKMDENIESLNNLKENLVEYGYNINDIPVVIQFNKQDLPGVMSKEDLSAQLNKSGWMEFTASATEGFGVFDTLKCILKLVLAKAKAGGAAQPSTKQRPAATETQQPQSQDQMQPQNREQVAPKSQEQIQPQNQEQVQPQRQEQIQPQNQEQVQPQRQEQVQPQEAAADLPQNEQVPPRQPYQVPEPQEMPHPDAAQFSEPERPAATDMPRQSPVTPVEPVPQPVFAGGPQYDADESDATRHQTDKIVRHQMEMPSEPEVGSAPPQESPPVEDLATRPEYRPFPGNDPIEEGSMPQSMHDIPAVQRSFQHDENITTDQPGGAQQQGLPRMAPSLRADKPKKKRSFFKRLFGLK